MTRRMTRRMTRLLLPAALLLSLTVAPAAAQFDQLPRGAVSASVGGAEVTIDYGRPPLDGRAVDELMSMLPEDRVWRAGENQVTILETSGAFTLGGETIPAGRYSLYLHIPESGDWSLLVNRHQGIRLGDLSSQAPESLWEEMWPMIGRYARIADREQARIPLSPATASGDGEVFEIAVADGALRFSWGGVAYSAAIGGS